MSEYLQFGQHPDADQVSAFVEQALPAHEQDQMLGHLAVCSECRAVVALSLPVVEEPAKLPAMHMRKPWFSGWNFAWPAAAAFATLAIIAFYLHRADLAPNAPSPNQIASVHPPAPIVSPAESTAASVKPAQHGSSTQSTGKTSAASVGKEQKQSPEALISSKEVAVLPMQGRNLASLDNSVQAPPVGQADKLKTKVRISSAVSAGMSGGLGTGTGYGAGIAANSSQVASDHLKAASPTAGAIFASAPSVTVSAAGKPSMQISESVNVQAGSSIETESADMAAYLNESPISQLQLVQIKHRLPSRLPVLSMATQGRRILAIDKHNAVFLSADAGKHWKAVYAQWPGQAVRASLVVFPTENRAGKLVSPELMNGTLTARDSSAAVVSGSSMIGTVTDRTGAVIPGASIAVIDNATHVRRSTKTDIAGRFLVNAVAPGTYRVEAQASGFNKQVLSDVAVAANQPAVVNLALNIGAATETVTVVAENKNIPTLKQSKTKPAAQNFTLAMFEIVTESGERWTSIDGVAWTSAESHSQK
jgi:uncharacterized surface anchored protein